MLNGWHKGERTGSGTIVWKARELLAAGEIDYQGFIELVASSAPSTGYCNTMGTATTMNSLAEALGMSLPGSAAIPAPLSRSPGMRLPHRQADRRDGRGRPQALGHPDARGVPQRDPRQLRDRRLDQRPIHLIAIARHMGVELDARRLGDATGTTSRCWSTCSRPASISARTITAPAACRRWSAELMRDGLIPTATRSP